MRDLYLLSTWETEVLKGHCGYRGRAASVFPEEYKRAREGRRVYGFVVRWSDGKAALIAGRSGVFRGSSAKAVRKSVVLRW